MKSKKERGVRNAAAPVRLPHARTSSKYLYHFLLFFPFPTPPPPPRLRAAAELLPSDRLQQREPPCRRLVMTLRITSTPGADGEEKSGGSRRREDENKTQPGRKHDDRWGCVLSATDPAGSLRGIRAAGERHVAERKVWLKVSFFIGFCAAAALRMSPAVSEEAGKPLTPTEPKIN